MTEIPKHPWSGPKDELVPTVTPDDLKTIWNVFSETAQRHATEGGLSAIAFGKGAFGNRLAPDADLNAVTYRAAILALLFQISESAKSEAPSNAKIQEQAQRFAKWRGNDVLFTVMARIPLHWLQDEGPGDMPLDLEDFLTQVEQAK